MERKDLTVEADLEKIPETELLEQGRKLRKRTSLYLSLSAVFMVLIIILYYARFIR